MAGAPLQTPVEGQAGDIARHYLSSVKHWRPGDFRLEARGLSKDHLIVVRAIHADDETASTPARGKSVELHIDPGQRRVVREYCFQ